MNFQKKIGKESKIYISGHEGFLGSAILRDIKSRGFKKIITISKNKLDLTIQKNTFNFIKNEKPDAIIICSAKVGGIKANNKYRAEFIYNNLSIQNNIIHAAYKAGVNNLIFFGSSCIYPKFSTQPILEKSILTGSLEYTNEPYAIAKIAGVKLCENYNLQYKTNYKCLMPSNIYGPNDNYNTDNSHFFSAIMKKIYLAKLKEKKSVIFWGTGKCKRELIFVDDVADACFHFLNKKVDHTLINIGSGIEKSIKQYAKFVAKYLNYKGKIIFDNNKKLDGVPRKIVNCKIANSYGWYSKYSFEKGFELTYKDFLNNRSKYLFRS